MERERLTITLRKDILRLVDQSIDGAKLRNRSHAIEYFLSQQLTPKTVRVVLFMESAAPRTTYQAGAVPVGVRGAMVADRADLRPIFHTLSSQAFKDIIIAGPDSPSLQAAVIDAEKYDISARTLPINIDGGSVADAIINQLQPTMAEEPFILWDTRFKETIDLSSFLEFHKNSRAVATAALSSNPADDYTGFRAQLHGSGIVAVSAKESMREGGLPVLGVFCFEPAVFNGATDKNKNLYGEILPKLAQAGKLSGFVFATRGAVKPVMAAQARRT